MKRRFTPKPFPGGWARERLAAWAADRLPALRAAPIPLCRHPGVTLLIYAFPQDVRFDLFEHAIRQSWAVLGALPTVVVTHDASLVPPMPGVEVQVEPTLRAGGLDAMSLDCITRLHTRFATPHVLIVQDDGFPLRDDLDRFLRYDYVGAPDLTPSKRRGRLADLLGLTVLNGGFSLRSRRVCRLAARLWRLNPCRWHIPPEDRFYSPLRLWPGMRFPPARVAAAFSQDALDDGHTLWPEVAPMGMHRALTFAAIAAPAPRLTVVSVVRDPACHRRCLLENPHLRGADFVTFDNTCENIPIPVRYNAFLDALPPDAEWILFAHEDFEPLADPRPLLRTRDPWFPLGLIGTRIVAGFAILPFGQIEDSERDGSRPQRIVALPRLGRLIGTMVEAFDCCGFFVHADLFRRLNLRFDPDCPWDLYAEALCYQYITKTGHLARLIPLPAHHWSRGDTKRDTFRAALAHLNAQYAHTRFAGGTCVALIGDARPLRLRLWRALIKPILILFGRT